MSIFSLSTFILFLLTSYLSPVLSAISNPSTPNFRDVSVAAGIQLTDQKLKKYGGPAAADLDNDGYPDLLFCHHDSSWAEIYFNNRNGKFVKSPFRLWTDMHALVVVPRSVYSRARRFTITSGGNYGKEPIPPRMFHVSGRKITEVTKQAKIDKAGGRGRTAIFMHLKKNRDHRHPDILYTNARPSGAYNFIHFGYKNRGPNYEFKRLTGFENVPNWFAMPTDIDGDGQMEVVSYQNLTFHKLIAPFTFRDITNNVLPPSVPRIGTVAVAEFDMDNDGDMDLYVARTNTGDLNWLRGTSWPDVLLENRNGKYVDVSRRAGLPANSASRGVTTGDFNNDGFMDIFVPQYVNRDILLLNRGDGTFKRVDGLITRPPNVRGDHAVAVDYDLDGRVDLVVAQGDQHNRALGGSYRIFQNILPKSSGRNYLHVRVGTAPNRSATALHAVVTVVAGGMRMTRRVGSPGDAVSRSFLETVHFGLRGSGKAKLVKVRWTNGVTSLKWNVQANSKVNFGII